MGFFSFLKPLVKVALPIVGAALGIEALGAVAGAVTTPTSKAEAQVSGLSPAAQQRVRTAGGPAGLTAQIAAQRAATAVPGVVSGRMRKRTTVETFDPVTGAVSRTVTFPGGVAVRASDVAAARRVFRQVRKLDGKLPRKTVKQSPVKMLTDRVIKNALEKAGDIDCPPKC